MKSIQRSSSFLIKDQIANAFNFVCQMDYIITIQLKHIYAKTAIDNTEYNTCAYIMEG